MHFGSLMKIAYAAAMATGLFAGSAALAQDTVKIGTIAPKTGPLAGGAAVTQWPNVELWVKQVNARGGLNVGGEQMMIKLFEYDDQTNPVEHI